MLQRADSVVERAEVAVSGAALAVAGALAAFAMVGTPVLAESAKRYNFMIAEHSAALLRWGVLPVALVTGVGVAILAAERWAIRRPRRRLIMSSLVLTGLVALGGLYLYSVLTPLGQLEVHMQQLDAVVASTGVH